MGTIENEERTALLFARLEDLCAASDRGDVGVSQFMSPRESHIAGNYLRSKGVVFVSYGGYSEAERTRIYILPDYMEQLKDIQEGFEEALSSFGYSVRICAVRITGSGYRTLTHRQYLGSVLGLGIERDVVGDVLVLDETGREAIIICDEVIADFLVSELTYVANDKVRTERISFGEWVAPIRRTQPIHDTVASPRLDAVVASLCRLSREKARDAVVSGLVELDYESEERPDRTLTAPSTVSVRGFGKFRISSLSDKTKKGRYRLEAEKYV